MVIAVVANLMLKCAFEEIGNFCVDVVMTSRVM